MKNKTYEILDLIKKNEGIITPSNEAIFINIISEILSVPYSEIYDYSYLIFKDSQSVSSQLLAFLNSNKNKSQVEKIMLTIIESKNNFLNKVKFLFNRKELDDFIITQIKDVYSDLLFEKNKYLLIQGKNERLFYISIVLDFLNKNNSFEDSIDHEKHSDFLDILKSINDILINNNFHLDILISKNKDVTKSFLNYVQNISLNVYKEILANSIGISYDINNKKIPQKMVLNIKAIEIIKEMALKKIDEFYSFNNIKILKSIFNEKNKNHEQSIALIQKIKSDMIIFKNSIDLLIAQIKTKTEELKGMDYNEEHENFIKELLLESLKINESLTNISEEINYKIEFVYSKY